MAGFPRTVVGGVSVSRLIIGSNWFVGCSHTSLAKDRFLKEYQTRRRIAQVLVAFLRRGVDTLMAGPTEGRLFQAVRDAEDKVGRKIIVVATPAFSLDPSSSLDRPEANLDACVAIGATFCFPHQSVTDALIDRRDGIIRYLDRYTRMIRERGMIPGLSTHMPEAVVYADRAGSDVESYIQPYNAAGFLMHIEPDWVQRIIQGAHKPVMTIKPLAAGRLLPAVALPFVWSTIREQDMVTVGTMTADEAEEVVDLSLACLEHCSPGGALQCTRSKRSLVGTPSAMGA